MKKDKSRSGFGLCLALLILLATIPDGYLLAQGLGVNTTGAAVAGSAMLDVAATNKGVLFPRMTKVQRNTIASPATGLLIYQVDSTPGYYYYDGAGWITLLTQSTIPQRKYAVFTSSGTFFTPSTITAATVFKVTLTGGGAGGFGAPLPPSVYCGGGAGATVISWVSGLTPSTGYTVTIGAGGSSSTVGGVGGPGGASSFLTMVAGGGLFGGPSLGPGGNASGGVINISGGDGVSEAIDINPILGFVGSPAVAVSGGASIWGANSYFYGAYGSGGRSTATFGTQGISGIMLIEWIE